MRAALGAGRGDLIRQLLAESLVLALASGALGLLLAQSAIQAASRISQLNLPRAGEVQINWETLAFTLLVSMATAAVFGPHPLVRGFETRPECNSAGIRTRFGGRLAAQQSRAG